MTLAVGTALGPYRVTAKIGEGGMGEVYRARDTNLDRDVAIKVLPEAFTSDPDRLARFEREAKVLASLNHPNIGAIYGLEKSGDTRALVLELIEGPTLAERIKQGPIPVDEALPIAKQIADALEAAHEQGVIHRDLKPANVKVKDDGTVKVLDFGLAKAFQPDANDQGLSQSPTISLTAAATQMGMVMGTAAYMSPEQASGSPVDKRADIWAFGVVLYEMLTGARPFAGGNVSETLARVIDREPDWAVLPDDLPLGLSNFLRHCLQKNPKKRVRDIGDVRLAMEGAFETTAQHGVAEAQTPGRLQGLPLAVGLLVAGAIISGVAVWTLTGPLAAPVTRFVVNLPTSPSLQNGPMLVAISPDGRTLVYSGADQLYRRDMAQLDWQPIPATENAVDPLFSPDGQWLAFEDDDGLKRVSVNGGPAATIVQGTVRGATWAPDDTIVFGQPATGLFRVSAAGGVPEPLTTLEEGEGLHQPSDTLPTGEAVLFTNRLATDQVAVVSLVSGDRWNLLAGSNPRYVATGHIVFVRDDALWAVPFDMNALEVTGRAVPVLEGVRIERNSRYAQFGVTNDGSLFYLPDEVGSGQGVLLVWLDRNGQRERTGLPIDNYNRARLSPDGTQVSLNIDGRANRDVWVSDVERNTFSRLTTNPAQDQMGAWTSDGERIVFSSYRGGRTGLFSRAADGTGEVQHLVTIENSRDLMLWGRPIDSGRLVFSYGTFSSADVALLSFEGEPSLQPVLDSEANEGFATVSPDGRWIAYASDETGDYEVYVQRFPDGGERQRVSAAGGMKPLWSPDGDTLFYVTRNMMMTVSVTMDPIFTAETPTLLFEADGSLEITNRGLQDISPDGQRFLALMNPSSAGEDVRPLPQMHVVQNWFEELTERVPIP